MIYHRLKFIFVLALSALFNPLAAADQQAAEVIKSPSDHRLYQPLKLKNGLQVMLISDPKADQAAAAMDVYVGSGDDPDDREGMAHYLEHMLFLGTEKYPDAGEYQKFIQTHGGSNNAYTVLSNTNYHFTIDPEFFEPALDRFAQFFIQPLFDEKYVQRERSVVDAEYKARLKDEGRRLWTARTRAYNPAHPSTGFSVGSLSTLADREGDGVREDLVAFYREHYHAGKMVLVVVGKEPLEQLQQWVEAKFAAIRAPGAERQAFSAPMFLPDALPKQITLKPLRELRRVTFSFPVPSNWPHYDAKPLAYLSNLLGHEGDGSLLSALKARAWASSLSAGRGYMDAVQGTVDISIELSPVGLKHVDAIGSMLFAAIKLINDEGVQQQYFDEQKQLAELEFKYLEEAPPASLAQSLASRLQRFSAQQVLIAPYQHQRFDADLIKRYLAALTPQNLLLTLVDPDFSSKQLTAHYAVEYAIKPIPDEWLEQWQSPPKQASLALPIANPFIPTDTALLASDLSAPAPRLLSENSGLSLWHQTLGDFAQPKSEFYFTIQSPLASASPKNAVLTQFYVNAINELLSSYTYPAYLAGLEYDLYRHSRGLSVRISGYSDKQQRLLERIVDALSIDGLSQAKFDQIKQLAQQRLENQLKGRPSDVLISSLYDVLLTSSWSIDEKLAVIENISRDDLRKHASALLEQIQVSALSVGNVSSADSQARADLIHKEFEQSLSRTEVPRARLRTLPAGQSVLREIDLPHPDSAAVFYYQGRDKSLKERAITRLLGALIRPDYYQFMRTENEIGYLVQAFAFNLLEVPSLAFSVQSSSHTVSQITALSDQFLQTYSQTLMDLTDNALEAARAGLISRLSQRDKTLGEVARRHWTDLDRKAHGFDSREQMITAVQGLSREDLLAFYQARVVSPERAEALLVKYGASDQSKPERNSDKTLQGQSLAQLRQQLKQSFPAY